MGSAIFALRVASAAVLAPIAIAGAYVGGWVFLALCAIAAGAILWEWTVLASGRADAGMLASGIGGIARGRGICGHE